jgi:DNA-binding response OmpR family regulator/tetratricopeptide (TPR) repeat protein
MSGYILIVESDPVLQRRIGDTLKEARYELASEAEVAWARRSIAVRAPDAIVVDTMLSDGDGFALAEDLRREAETRATPIFFIASRFRGASHRAEARRRFAPAEYLPVPLDVNSLLALILEAVPPATGATGNGASNGTSSGRGDAIADGTPAEIHAATTQPIASSRSQVTPLPSTEAKASPASLRDPVQQRERRDVERSAKSLVAEKAELTGTLKRDPFARLMQRLYSRRASGSLLLLRNTTKKIVSFVDGYPVAVRSNVLGECLGQILLGQKLISNQTLAESVKRMQREKRRQGEVLVEMGALSPFNLSRALVEQAEAKLFEIFSWRDGRFMFKKGESAPKEAMRLARSPAALILEGIRRYYDAARQVAVLDHYARRFVALNADPVLRLQEMTDDPTELGFIRGIDGNERLETILDRAEIARDKAGMLLVALSEAGMITPADAPTTRPAAGPGQLTPAATATAPQLPTAAPRPAVHRHEQRSGRADDAPRTRDHRLHDSPAAQRLVGDLDDDLDLGLRLGLDDESARFVDANPTGSLHAEAAAQRAAIPGMTAATGAGPSAMPLGSVPLSMVAQTVRTQDYFWALGVGRAATTEEINQAYDALARTFHADGYRNSPDEDRRLAQEIFDRLSEAHRVLRHPAQRQAYADRIDRLDAESLSAPAHGGAADGGATAGGATAGTGAAPGPPVPTTAGNATAQALYDSGLAHLRARRHHEAVEAFRQAARLVPGEADFRAALGWSLFREAPADARAGGAALAELRRAVQIDGRNLRALHYLAGFYAETGQADLAIEELEKILQIDPSAPNAVEAADQLRRLRQR